MIVIGIDPGLSGAVAAINGRGEVSIIDIPTKPMEWAGMGANRVDCRALARGLRTLYPADESLLVCMEQVGIQGAGKNAIQTVGSLCGTACLILGALDIIGIAPKTITPSVWKKHYGLKRQQDEKESAWKARHCDLARTLYPRAPITLAKHHNRAESLLIAHYGRSLL